MDSVDESPVTAGDMVQSLDQMILAAHKVRVSPMQQVCSWRSTNGAHSTDAVRVE